MPQLTQVQMGMMIDKIVREADKAIKAAQAVELVLQERHNDLLRTIQRSGRVSKEARAEIERIGADLQVVRMAVASLALETMMRIDASAEVAEIKKEITAVRNTLKQQKARLSRITASAAKVERATEAVLKVINGLAKFSTKLT